MLTVIPFIETYGYLAVFAGAVFEGESIVLLGGLSSHEMYLSFPLVVAFATLGAITGDWTFYLLGKYRREALLKRFPNLEKLTKTPINLIERKPRLISFAMRFMYGFRHIVPFSIGASKVPTHKFLLWNGLGAVLWATTFTIGGYIAGNILEEILGDIRRYEFRIIVVTILIVATFWGIRHTTRFVLRQKQE
jgi:membrane protein DedA with SNARE-associated domain